MKQVIVLDRSNINNYIEVSYVLWLTVPAAQQYIYANSDPNLKSAFAGATTLEIDSLKNGAVFEKTGRKSYPTGITIAQIKSDLINLYNQAQSELTNNTQYNFYGTYWDGTSWVNP